MYHRVLHRRYRRKRIFFLLLIFAVLMAVTYYTTLSTYDFFSRDKDYDQLIEEAAERHNLDSLFLKAVIWQESSFKPFSVGGSGEIGLMQLMHDKAVEDWTKVHQVRISSKGLLFDPRLNIEIGAWYLSKAMRKWKDYKDCRQLALCQYNAGGRKAREWRPPLLGGDVIERIKYPSTKAYVKAILKKYEEYSERRKAK